MLIQSLNLKNLFLNKFKMLGLIFICMAALSFQAQGMVILSTIEKPEIGYYKELLERFYKWYNLTYFDFDKKLSPLEKKMVHGLIDEISQTTNLIDSRTEMPRIRWELESKDKNLTYGNLFVSIADGKKDQLETLKQILHEQGLPLLQPAKDLALYGIEWALDKGEISIFYLKQASVKNSSEYEDLSLIQIVYKNKKEIDQVKWLKIRNLEGKNQDLWAPGTLEVWDVISKAKTEKYVVTSLFPSKKFGEQLRAPLRKILQEFNYSPQAILIENENNLKIYYQ